MSAKERFCAWKEKKFDPCQEEPKEVSQTWGSNPSRTLFYEVKWGTPGNKRALRSFIAKSWGHVSPVSPVLTAKGAVDPGALGFHKLQV